MAVVKIEKQEMGGKLPMVCMRCGAPATISKEKRFELPEKEEAGVGFGVVGRILTRSDRRVRRLATRPGRGLCA